MAEKQNKKSSLSYALSLLYIFLYLAYIVYLFSRHNSLKELSFISVSVLIAGGITIAIVVYSWIKQGR